MKSQTTQIECEEESKMGKPPTIAQAIKAIKKHRGTITYAARECKISRSTFYKMMKKDSSLAEAVEDAKESLLDLAEIKLYEKIEQGDLTAIIFTLKTQGYKRGWSQSPQVHRVEVSGPGGGPVQSEDVTLDDENRANRIMAILDAARTRRDRGDT